MSRDLRKIPFSPPDIRAEDIAAVTACLESGWITSGPIGERFSHAISEYCGTEKTVLTNSCTAALELALRILNVGPGDEVIVPAYTYTASASVVCHVGAQLALVDTAPGDYFPSPATIAEAVSPRTKAIIVVDFAGIPYPVEELRDLVIGKGRVSDSAFAPQDRPAIIVDGAHSIGASRHGAQTGSLGDFTAFSFHAVKNITTAEGGALTWNSRNQFDSEECATVLKRMTLHGQTKDALTKNKAGSWEYDIVDTAYKMNMPDVLAAIGYSQLKRVDEVTARRHDLLSLYEQHLSEAFHLLKHQGSDWRSSAHLAIVELDESYAPLRNEIISRLGKRGVAANVHYKPLPLLTAYRKLGFSPENYPHAMEKYSRELTLPLHTLLSDDDAIYIAETLNHFVSELESTKK